MQSRKTFQPSLLTETFIFKLGNIKRKFSFYWNEESGRTRQTQTYCGGLLAMSQLGGHGNQNLGMAAVWRRPWRRAAVIKFCQIV